MSAGEGGKDFNHPVHHSGSDFRCDVVLGQEILPEIRGQLGKFVAENFFQVSETNFISFCYHKRSGVGMFGRFEEEILGGSLLF